MISVILPYWNRYDATRKAMDLYAKHYANVDMEVILVDDGCHDFNLEYPFLRIIRLEKKTTPLNPCVPINRGVSEAKGDIIAISNPEILHNYPVLPQMRDELTQMGELGYVLAACWCEEDKCWHCHPSLTADGYHGQLKQPKGSGFHFLAMMHRTLWDKAGGFDEEYRNGWCYDDPDFVMRINRAGGIFKIMTDLVVEHPRNGANSNWNLPSNKGLYLSKWESA